MALAAAPYLLALAAISSQSVPERRQLAPEDFSTINDLLSRISVTLPTISTTAVGVDISLINLTCSGARLSDIVLTTQQIDARTFDVRPTVTGVSVACTASWSYVTGGGLWFGSGSFGASATGASLAAVLRIIPLDFDIVDADSTRSPPPAPTAYHTAPCQAKSGCNSACGVTPTDYAAANIITATPQQCYFCDSYWFSPAPEWCTYKSHSLLQDLCCVLHDCIGENCQANMGDANALARPPPPPSTAPCTRSTQCNSPCGVSPAEYKDAVGLPDAEPNQCFACHKQAYDITPGTCTWRQANTFGDDLCCVMHECDGNCPAPPPAPPTPCSPPSGCNYGCGVTPPEYAIAAIPRAAPDQCYFCDSYYTSNAPGKAE